MRRLAPSRRPCHAIAPRFRRPIIGRANSTWGLVWSGRRVLGAVVQSQSRRFSPRGLFYIHHYRFNEAFGRAGGCYLRVALPQSPLGELVCLRRTIITLPLLLRCPCVRA